jgi:thiol:disulfide interchange protein DsbD
MAERFHAILIILLRSLVVIIPLVVSGNSVADTVGERLLKLFGSSDDQVLNEEEILDPEQAFRFSAVVSDDKTVNLMWQIEDGYYLYHDKFSVTLLDSDGEIALGQPVIPAGTMKTDDSFGSMEVNTGDVVIDVPVRAAGENKVSFTLQVGYQGCKENSICYPPIKRQVPLVLAGMAATKKQ